MGAPRSILRPPPRILRALSPALAAVVAFVVVLAAGARDADACTAFALPSRGGTLVAKSYDWDYGGGLAFANPRGERKRALLIGDRGPALEWTARFASLTFNQLGRDLPMGGLNEAGLVVEILWLRGTRTPAPDGRPAVNESQWIQWQLDTSASVDDVLRSAPTARVAPVRAPVHYFVCDGGGACATLEYLGGRLVTHAGSRLRAPALANGTYAEELAHLRRHVAFGGARAIPRDRRSRSRFVRAAAASKLAEHAGLAGPQARAFAFAALDSVEQPRYTQWQIVYEPARGRAHFRAPGETRATIFDVAVAAARTCREPRLVADLRGTLTEDSARPWRPLDPALQRRSLEEGLRGAGATLPEDALDRLAPLTSKLARCGAAEAPATAP